MWVAPDQRRKGLGLTILHALEDASRRLGYRALRLETGAPQTAPSRCTRLPAMSASRGMAGTRDPLEVSFERRLD